MVNEATVGNANEGSGISWFPERVSTDELRDVAEQMGHHSSELLDNWQIQAEKGSLVMFAVRDGQAVIASTNLLVSGLDEPAVKEEIGDVPTIIALGVKEAYRRKSIGSRLMEACEEYVRSHSALPQRIALGVVAPNTPARAMYESMGYQYQTVGGAQLYDTSWPEVDADGNNRIHTAQCLLMIKTL